MTAPQDKQDNLAHIQILASENRTRPDLAIELDDSGTGIGQVLAILFVVLTSHFPQTIIIDEPQSFLHPGAVRKLFEILRNDFSQHQYIITTHSPTAITASEPKTLFLLQKVGSESSVTNIDVKKEMEVRSYLLELGARLSDVFGADRILWVEGPTEEQCFPLILNKPLLGTKILGVVSTGDIDGKHSQKVLDIYRRFGGEIGLLPLSASFIFDREKRSPAQIEALERQGVSFLPRMMFENYLLNPGAIAHVLSTELPEYHVTPDDVREWLETNCWNRNFVQLGPNEEQTDDLWLRKVHGAKLLNAMFNELSGGTNLSYNSAKGLLWASANKMDG